MAVKPPSFAVKPRAESAPLASGAMVEEFEMAVKPPSFAVRPRAESAPPEGGAMVEGSDLGSVTTLESMRVSGAGAAGGVLGASSDIQDAMGSSSPACAAHRRPVVAL